MMKKLVTLFFAAGLVFSAAGGALAAEFKASGQFLFTFDAHDAIGGGGNQNNNNAFMSYQDTVHNRLTPTHHKHGGAIERMRLGMTFTVSENLSAYYMLQVGSFTWGGPTTTAGENYGGAIGSRAVNLSTRFAWIDWAIPNTKIRVRMGQQDFNLPAYTFTSPVQNNPATAVLVSGKPAANISLTGAWVRANSDLRRGAVNVASSRDDNADLFYLAGNFSHDGFTVAPWAIVGLEGKNVARVSGATQNGTDWLIGLGLNVTKFDPFRFTFDALYSIREIKPRALEYRGFYAAAGLEYKTSHGTPALKGWYASGEDGKQENGHERIISYNPSFNATNTYFNAGFSAYDVTAVANNTAAGTWGISLQWNRFSFVEKLSHDASITWISGTNSKKSLDWVTQTPAKYLTVKDSLIEVNVNSTYSLYQNLSAVLQLAYLVENFDREVWGREFGLNVNNGERAEFSNIFRASLSFVYNF
jgi:hypothetical protein